LSRRLKKAQLTARLRCLQRAVGAFRLFFFLPAWSFVLSLLVRLLKALLHILHLFPSVLARALSWAFAQPFVPSVLSVKNVLRFIWALMQARAVCIILHKDSVHDFPLDDAWWRDTSVVLVTCSVKALCHTLVLVKFLLSLFRVHVLCVMILRRQHACVRISI